jgi:hypothetical protein
MTNLTNEDIWNMSIPKNIIHCFLRVQPTNRKEWAKAIYNVISAIEQSTCMWDNHSLKILDDAYNYCEAYNLYDMKNKIVEYHTKYFTDEDISIDMNDIRNFFHDEWFNPTDDESLTLADRYPYFF